MSEHPTCISLILCDQVIDDKRSNNKSFIGAFNAIYSQILPCNHPRMSIVVSLTNLLGLHTLAVSIRTPSDVKAFEAKGETEANDPLQVFDIVFEILGFPVAEVGTYFIDAFCDDIHVATRRFQVIQPNELPEI